MKRLVAVVALACLIAACHTPDRPSIRVINRTENSIEWTVNDGETMRAYFSSAAECDRYEKYLGIVGVAK